MDPQSPNHNADPQPQLPLPSPSLTQVRPPPEIHQSNADEDDENVKQLNECSFVYLSLQDCLVKTNRNWKSCQMGTTSIPLFLMPLSMLMYTVNAHVFDKKKTCKWKITTVNLKFKL